MTTSTAASVVKTSEERWKDEAAFFDRAAEWIDVTTLPIDPMALQRYARPVLRRRFNKEYRFKVMGSVEGKVLLDVGCGDGQNSVMLALMGAQVTGVDVSPGAIEVARRRAEVNGVSDHTSFLCAPIEKADLPDGSFDIVWGEGILHHVLDDLERVLRCLARCVKREGLLIFSEPITLSPMLRRIRQSVPIRTDATPGERPMHRKELDLVHRYVPDLVMRSYSILGRLDRLILVRFNYERSTVARRGIVNGLATLDWFLMFLPGLKRLAGSCVLHGHPARNDS